MDLKNIKQNYGEFIDNYITRIRTIANKSADYRKRNGILFSERFSTKE